MLPLNIRDLGQLDDPMLVFGGPYSNAQALNAVLAEADRRDIPPNRIVCTGDIVAYCADALACLHLMAERQIPVIAGNCEKQLANGADDCGCGFEEGSACNALSVAWYAHARQQIGRNYNSYLAGLPDRITFEHCGQRYGVVHGGASEISTFIWPSSTDDQIRSEIALLETQVGPVDCVLAGHSGLPFQRDIGTKKWINAGAIGMPPNDGRDQTRFVHLQDGKATIHHLSYDAVSARKAMEEAGLTHGYHSALTVGYWPSEDVLPPDLRRVNRVLQPAGGD